MKEKPIIFSTPMVQAILEGRKTMMRRVFKSPMNKYVGYRSRVAELFDDVSEPLSEKEFYEVYSPYSKGDILWVRETWRCMGFDDDEKEPKALIQYRDETSRWVTMENYQRFWNHVVGYAGWLSPVSMYREAARIFLEVKSVRVERLWNISEREAYREGITTAYFVMPDEKTKLKLKSGGTFITAFKYVWNDLNAKRGCSWDSNPWVWVIEFERVE